MGYIFENYAKGAGGALNNHVDQILTNFDPLEWTRVDILHTPPPPCPRGQQVEKRKHPPKNIKMYLILISIIYGYHTL
jgi:hypothetical protein